MERDMTTAPKIYHNSMSAHPVFYFLALLIRIAHNYKCSNPHRRAPPKDIPKAVGTETRNDSRQETGGVHKAECLAVGVAEVLLPLIDTLQAVEQAAIICLKVS